MNNQGEKTEKYTIDNRDWETATYGALMFSLREYKDRLEEERAYKLNSKPRELDVRIIDKLSDSNDRMDNAIAYIFEKHNIIELKNPREALNIDIVWKGISYAAQYKSSGFNDIIKRSGVDAISIDDVTLTFIRVSRPNNLFKEMISRGYEIENRFPGVYYIKGMADIKIQIVVGSELEGDEFRPLRVQRRNAKDNDVQEYMVWTDTLNNPNDREMAELILMISYSENRDTYVRLRGYWNMKMTKSVMIRDLFHDEFEDAETRFKTEEKERMAKRLLRKGMPENEIADVSDLSIERIRQLAEESGVIV